MSQMCPIWGQTDPIRIPNLTSLLCDTRDVAGIPDWVEKCSDWHQNGANPGTCSAPKCPDIILILTSRRFFLINVNLTCGHKGRQMHWNLIWKSPGFIPFGGQSDPLLSQTYHHWQRGNDWAQITQNRSIDWFQSRFDYSKQDKDFIS